MASIRSHITRFFTIFVPFFKITKINLKKTFETNKQTKKKTNKMLTLINITNLHAALQYQPNRCLPKLNQTAKFALFRN